MLHFILMTKMTLFHKISKTSRKTAFLTICQDKKFGKVHYYLRKSSNKHKKIFFIKVLRQIFRNKKYFCHFARKRHFL